MSCGVGAKKCGVGAPERPERRVVPSVVSQARELWCHLWCPERETVVSSVVSTTDTTQGGYVVPLVVPGAPAESMNLLSTAPVADDDGGYEVADFLALDLSGVANDCPCVECTCDYE